MPLYDLQNTASDAQAITSVATVASTNTIDLGAPATLPRSAYQAYGSPIHDVFGGAEAPLIDLRVVETFDSAEEDAVLKVDFIVSANADLSAPVVVMSTGIIAEATLVAGYRFRFGQVAPVPGHARYCGFQYTVTVHAFTAGKVTGGLALKGANSNTGSTR
jgi:hypothetical protein